MNMGMGGPLGGLLESSKNDNMLTISWVDSAWVPILNANNVMDYFSEPRNPFYDRTCNNEMLKMQRASLDQLPNMMGIEFCLLYVQEPILYVVRKQQRHSPTQVSVKAWYQSENVCSKRNFQAFIYWFSGYSDIRLLYSGRDNLSSPRSLLSG